MTITIAWLRQVSAETREMVIASDSRLRCGRAWDCGPKILPLQRNDAVLAFAGDTDDAYPMMLQMQSAITHFPAAETRALDVIDLKGHLLRVANGMREQIHDLPIGQKEPDPSRALLVLAGYSWRKSDFRVWLLHYDTQLKRFTFRPGRRWRGVAGDRRLVFAGDYEDDFRARLTDLLRDRGKLTAGGFNWEPLEILRDMLLTGDYPAIGGAPQVVKLYRHMNSLPFVTMWPPSAPKPTVLGRPLLDYERTQLLALDMDTLTTSPLWSYLECEDPSVSEELRAEADLVDEAEHGGESE